MLRKRNREKEREREGVREGGEKEGGRRGRGRRGWLRAQVNTGDMIEISKSQSKIAMQ